MSSGDAIGLEIELAIAVTLLKRLGRGESRLRSTSGLAGESGSVALDTAGNTSLVANLRADSLGTGAGGGHVGIDVGEDVGTTVLVDQIDVVRCGLTLDRHDLELVDHVLESTTGGEGGVGGLDVGLVGIGSIDDSLVVELINLSVVGNKSSLLESGIVLDASAGVEEVGDHGGVGHPVRDGSGEVTSSGGLAVGSGGTSASACVHVLGSLLLGLTIALLLGLTIALLLSGSTLLLLSGSTLLLLVSAIVVVVVVVVSAITIKVSLLSEGSSKNCGREKRGDENVLHGECNMSDQPN